MAPIIYQENDGVEGQCIQGLSAQEYGVNYGGESITLALSHYSITFSKFHLTRLNNPGWPGRKKSCTFSPTGSELPCSASS